MTLITWNMREMIFCSFPNLILTGPPDYEGKDHEQDKIVLGYFRNPRVESCKLTWVATLGLDAVCTVHMTF